MGPRAVHEPPLRKLVDNRGRDPRKMDGDQQQGSDPMADRVHTDRADDQTGITGATGIFAEDGVPITSEDGMCSCGNALPCGVEVEIDGARYVRHDNILDEALQEYRDNYGDDSITKDDIFYYVYGVLHSPLYVARYQNNLRRELPRIPMAPDFWAFCYAGRRLSELHLSYETCPEYPLAETPNAMGERPAEHLLLTKRMQFVDARGKRVKNSEPATAKHSIKVNEHITLTGIPPEAHEYVVNGRTPLEWMLDRYQIKTDKDSGIVHDPNEWFAEVGDDIVSKLKRITWMSIETAKVIATLPTPFADGWKPAADAD